MEDQYNLIYNGKMLYGMDGYLKAVSSTQMTMDTVDKPAGCAASFVMPKIYTENSILEYLIPYFPNDKYRFSFKLKGNLSSAGKAAQYSHSGRRR